MKLFYTLFLAILLTPLQHYAQGLKAAFSYYNLPIVNNDYGQLKHAWAGGLNAPQYNAMRLNADDVEDLVIYDKAANKIYTFVAELNKGKYQYTYTPIYESFFPKDIDNWLILRDFNCDGLKDIFTSTTLGIKVYKNVTPNGGKQAFVVEKAFLQTTSFSGSPLNLQVGSSDLPAIEDVDQDGDLDILTFELSGSSVEWHQNQSMQINGTCNQLVFKKVTGCWGGFMRSHDCGSDYTFGVNCQVQRISGAMQANETNRVTHTGASMLLLDLDADRDLDALVSSIDCKDLTMLNNKGTVANASFTDVQRNYPSQSQTVPVNFHIYPAAYYQDVDFDGKKDLLVSPNVAYNDGNEVNFRQSSWLYANEGSNDKPTFKYPQPDFLQGQMIDLGEEAMPAFADYDADGDMDLFVGYRGNKWDRDFYGGVALYRNIGSPSKAVFKLVTEDYLGLSGWRISNVKPMFTDVDGDQLIDFVFTGILYGSNSICYIPNESTYGKPFKFRTSQTLPLPFSISSYDCPVFIDVDKDGLNDLLIGKYGGNLTYHRNIGSAKNPLYYMISDNFGGIKENIARGNLNIAVADFNYDGLPDLITGDNSGTLRLYNNFLDYINQGFKADTLLFRTPLLSNPSRLPLSPFIAPAATDLDADGYPDLVIGQSGGGLLYLHNTTLPGTQLLEVTKQTSAFSVFPNPATETIFVNATVTGTIHVYGTDGREYLEENYMIPNKNMAINLSGLQAGIYFVKLAGMQANIVKQISIIK